jgi:hypothetical protein
VTGADGHLLDQTSGEPIRSIDAVDVSNGVAFLGGPSGIPGRPASVRTVDTVLARPDGVILAGTRAFSFVGSSTGHVGWENVGPGDAYVRMYGRDGRLLWQRVLRDSCRVFVGGIASDGDALYLSGSTDGAFPGYPALGRADAFVARIPIPGGP